MPLSDVRGIAFPMRFGAAGHFVRASGKDKIVGNMKALITIRLRELPMEPEKGTPAISRSFGNTDAPTSSIIATLVRQALQVFEDRVIVRSVRVVAKDLATGRALFVEVVYKIRDTQEQGSFNLRVGGDV